MPPPAVPALDVALLRLESDAVPVHVAWKGRCGPRAAGRPPELAQLRRAIAGRLRHAERLRRRLVRAGGPDGPHWADDPAFDLTQHVLALGAPGAVLSPRRFDALCEEVLARPLDRARPPWRLYLAPRLEDGGAGIVFQLHHALAEGLSAAELALLVLDETPDAVVPAGLPGRRASSAAAPAGAAEPLRAARPAAHRRGGRLAHTLSRAAFALDEDPGRLRTVAARRAIVHHATPLAPLAATAAALGATVEDLALATVAGAIGAAERRAGRTPVARRALVPDGTHVALLELPLHLAGAEERVAAVVAARRGGRGDAGARVPLARDDAARLGALPRLACLTVASVTGPDHPLYLLGHPLREAVPVLPVLPGHALAIGLAARDGRLTFGITADPARFPLVDALPALLAEALGALPVRDAVAAA